MASFGFLRKVTLKGWIIGGIMIAAGIASLFFAYNAHMDILQLMPTTDPDELQEISDLEDQRGLYINLAFGALFVGIFAIFVMTERTLPSDIAQRQMLSEVRMTNELVTNLNLDGSAAYVPAKYALSREKVMIPSSDAALALPIMTDDLVFSLGSDRATLGIFLTPPGLDLLDGFERDLAVSNKGIGLEAFEGNMQVVKLGHGLVKDFKIKERGGEIILRLEHSTFKESCDTIRMLMPNVCRQAGCPICSAFLTGIARSTGKVTKILRVDKDTDRIQFHLMLSDW